MTWVITMALMVPTTVYVHLRLPRMRALLESVTILPIVIPPVVLIVGVLQVMPLSLRSSVWLLGLEYVILALPFGYRAIDAGLRAIDVKTLTEASGSLGAGRLVHAVAGAAAEHAHRDPLVDDPDRRAGPRRVHHGQPGPEADLPGVDRGVRPANANISVAASIFALLVTWILLMLITLVATRQSRRTGGGEVTLFTVAPRETIGN